MILKLIALIARLTVGKHIVSAIAWAHLKAVGRRSEIVIAVLAVVHGLKLVGVLPQDTAEGIESALSAILPITLAEKVSKAKALLDNAIPQVPPTSQS